MAFVCVSIAALDVFVFTDVFDELSECSEMSACASEMETLTVEIRGEPLQTYLSGPKNNCLQQHKIEALLWTPPPSPQPPGSSILLFEAVFVCSGCSTTIPRVILGTERSRQECLPRSLATFAGDKKAVIWSSK